MKRLCTLLFLAMLLYCSSYCQQSVSIHFKDVATGNPVPNVTIFDKNGVRITMSDTSGRVSFDGLLLENKGYVLALHEGYSIDTISAATVNVVYLQRLAATLNAVEVSGATVKRLLNENEEYVVDYDFAGDTVAAISYSGNNGGHAKLHLLSGYGAVLASAGIPGEPQRIFKSCLGNCYCVYKDKFYPVELNNGKIKLRQAYDIKLLRGMEDCNLSISGNLYYRKGDKQNFIVIYEVVKKGDTAFKPIIKFEEPDVAEASFYEYIEIIALLESGTPVALKEASRRYHLRKKWDKGSFDHINIPVFSHGDDTLVIFDYFKKCIRLFDPSGRAIGIIPAKFDWKQSQRFEIIKDEPLNKFYIHRYSNPSAQTLEELDINTGYVASNKIPIQRPCPENIKVHNGNLYFLWQDSRSSATRQLFIQKMN